MHLLNVLCVSDMLGPARYSSAAGEATEFDGSAPLSEADEAVIPGVHRSLVELLTQGIQSVASFARIARAICWGFAATEFTHFLKTHKFNSYALDETSYWQLCTLASHALVTYIASGDYSSIRKLLDVAVRLHTIEHRMTSELDVESCTVTMLSTLAAEPRIWAHEGLWSGIFYEGFTATVVRSQLANPGDKVNTEECRQYAFAELTFLTNAMCEVGVPASEVAAYSHPAPPLALT